MDAAQMKAFYDENGYVVAERLFDAAEIAAASARVSAIIADPDSAPEGVSVGREGDTVGDGSARGTGAVRGIAFLARFDPFFREFSLSPKLLAIVRALIGERIKLFRDQALMKPPGGQAKPLHQDQSYFLVRPIDALVTAWVALDEATVENGCMQYVPGSHRHGIFEVAQDPERPVHHVPQTPGLDLPAAVMCPVPAGSVIFHHGCALHASADNESDSWRRALIYHFAAADAVSDNALLNEQVTAEID
jgi:phytanoyl-CoA hydroxylase